MTRGERDYSKGKIYEMRCNITGDRYVGSTCKDYLSQRRVKHEADFKMWKVGKMNFITSFYIIERGNYDMVLLENFPCQSKDQLHARERYYIETLECVNKNIPTRTKEEWNKDNAEKIKNQTTKYRQEHCGELKEYFKQHYNENKETIKLRVKQHQEEHKEERKEYMKQYSQEHKEEISKRMSEKVKCECGVEVSRRNISTHKKSKAHQGWAQTK